MSELAITHVGGPTVLLEVEGWRILTDPTFDPPGREYRFGWGTGSRKVSGPAVAAADIGAIDAVLLTHDHHADNLDDAGRALLPGAGTVLTTKPGAARLGGNARGMAPWDTTTLQGPGRPTIEVTATPCRHGPPGSRPVVGQVVGFALRWDGQRNGAVWISGDTVRYRGLDDVATRVDVGTAIVHLGGVRFPITGPVRYTMTAHDAVELLTAIDPATIVPVHYEGWAHFQQDRVAIERELAELPGPLAERLRWAVPGEPLMVEA